MKSRWFFPISALIACFVPTGSKSVEWSSSAATVTPRARIPHQFQDVDGKSVSIQNGNHGPISPHDLACTTLSEMNSMKFYAKPQSGCDKLVCVDCELSGTPSEVRCINKNYMRAVPPEWKCSTVFPLSGFRIIGHSLSCDFRDRRKCYEPGICVMSIFVDRNPSQMVTIALITVGVMTIFSLFLLLIKHCTRKVQSPARSRRQRARDLPVRREALADHLRRNLRDANSPDVHRAVTIPVRANPPPSQASHNHLDDPPPSYEQVVGASK